MLASDARTLMLGRGQFQGLASLDVGRGTDEFEDYAVVPVLGCAAIGTALLFFSISHKNKRILFPTQ